MGWTGRCQLHWQQSTRQVCREARVVGGPRRWWLRCSGEGTSTALVVVEDVRVVGWGVGG